MQDSWAAAYFELRDKCTERLISLAFLTGGNVLQSVKRDVSSEYRINLLLERCC